MSNQALTGERSLPLLRRYWIYQAERFPVLAHGLPIAVMTFAMQSWAMGLAGEVTAYRPLALLGAFLAIFGFFFQLRVADEFKDREVDRRYRAERPVPRGLVGLGELLLPAGLFAAIQALVAWLCGPLALLALAAVWGYGALMSLEFGCSSFLRRRPGLVLLSHMAILPLIALFDVAVQWSALGGLPAHWQELVGAFLPVLLLVYASGLGLEIGRKIRLPQGERRGVETYSKAWGLAPALAAWCLCFLLSGLGLFLAQEEALYARLSLWAGLAMLAAALLAALATLCLRSGGAARFLEPLAALWIVAGFTLLAIPEVLS